jgi:hypothetical protein
MMKNEKKFDSVKLMREIRNKIDKEISGLSNEEIIRYFRKRKNEYENKNVKAVIRNKA